MLVQHLYFKLNDYQWLEDVKQLNQRNRLQSSTIAQTHLKSMRMKKEILAGTSNILSPNLMALTKAYVEDKEREIELNKQIEMMNQAKAEDDQEPLSPGAETNGLMGLSIFGTSKAGFELQPNLVEFDMGALAGEGSAAFSQLARNSAPIPDWRNEGISAFKAFF